MLIRTLVGCSALGLYGWRLQDPVGAYAGFFGVADWLTGWFVAGSGVEGWVRNAINLALIDQAGGFLLGIVVTTLLAGLFWPFRVAWRVLLPRRDR